MKPKSSSIWNCFDVVSADAAKCKLCLKVYSRKGKATTSLKSHLKAMHMEEYDKFTQSEVEKIITQPSTSTATPLQEAKKQITLKETLLKNQKWCNSNPKSMEIDRLISEMIALQDLPFNFVEGIGFRRLMQFVAPNYKLRGRQFFTDYICGELYERLAKKINDLLNQFEKISFTTDIWSDPSSNVSLLSITAHAINEEFDRLKVILKCHTFQGRHTGEEVEKKLNDMLTEWKITYEKIHCFIRDSGSNIVRAMKLAHIPDASCTVHQLQLCVRNTLDCDKDVKEVLSKCKKIATHFNHSQIAQSELHTIQKEQLNQDVLGVVQECSTRWNSAFYMVERLIKIQDSICLYASKHSIPQISPEEWLHLKKLVVILQPFEEITRNMSDSSTSISSVIPLIHTLKHTLQIEENKPDTTQKFKAIIKCAIEQLNSRFGDLHDNNLFAISTYLDPRYKTKFFNEVIKEKVESELMTLLDDNRADDAESENIDVPAEKRQRLASPTAGQSCNVQSVLSNILLSSDEDEDNNASGNNPVLDKFIILKALINEYNREKRIAINEDPLLWWKTNTKYKSLYSIARQYLSCPPSSVASEQLFSGAGLIYDPLRSRLQGDKAAKLLFIKYNLLLLESLNLI